MPSDILLRFAEALASNEVRVVDLTQTLRPATPVIQLPPPFGASSPFRIEEISHYDDRGPGSGDTEIRINKDQILKGGVMALA